MKLRITLLLITALILTSACGSKQHEIPFSSKIEDGVVCALIHTNDLQEEILGSQLLNSLPSLRPFLLKINLAQLLDFKSDSVFLVSDFKRATAYVEINSPRNIQEQMDTWFKDVVAQQDSISDFAVYTWEREDLGIAFNNNCIIFTHKNPIAQKVNRFIAQNQRKATWDRILKTKHRNQKVFAMLRDTLNPQLRIFAYDTLINEELALHFRAESSQELPFLLENLEQGFKNGDMGVNFHYIAKKTNRVEHYLFKALEKVGLQAENMQRITTGDYRFFKGGEIEIKRDVISTEMDENFNTVEIKKTITEKMKGFSVELSGDEKAIHDYLLDTGVLTKSGNRYQLIYESKLHLNSRKGLFSIGSSENPTPYTSAPPFMWLNTPLLDLTIPFIDYQKHKVSFTLFIDGKGELAPPAISIF